MSDVVAALVPQMLGLVVTPGAIVACLLLLASSRPLRNVVAFTCVFVGIYAVVALILLAVGRTTAPGDSATTVRSVTHLVVGLLFLAAAAVTWRRGSSPERVGPIPAAAAATATALTGTEVRVREPGPEPAGSTPGWMGHLTDPSLRLVLGLAAVLAVVNPNVAILASGVSTVVAGGLSGPEQLLAVGLLLAATLVDFVVPSLVYVTCGARGHAWLARARGWLVEHNHVIGLVVLLVFGLLFTVQGLAALDD